MKRRISLRPHSVYVSIRRNYYGTSRIFALIAVDIVLVDDTLPFVKGWSVNLLLLAPKQAYYILEVINIENK